MIDDETELRRQLKALSAVPLDNDNLDGNFDSVYGLSSMDVLILLTRLCEAFKVQVGSLDMDEIVAANTPNKLLGIVLACTSR